MVVVDRKDDALAMATDLGADLTVKPGDDAAANIRDHTHGVGAHVVLDSVGADPTMALGAAITRQTGDLTIVGIADGTIPFSFFTMPYEVSIQTTYWGSRPELIEVLDLASRGLIAPHCTTFPLSEAVHAYELLARGEVSGRAVIVP